MADSIVEKLKRQLEEALSDQSKIEKRIKDLALEYRKALFGPSYEKPEPIANTCSFCGKSETNVEQLVAGAKVFICNECIELCYEIIHEPIDGKDI